MTKVEKNKKLQALRELKNLLKIINFVPPSVYLPSAEEITKKLFKDKTNRDLTEEDMENLEPNADFMDSIQKTIKTLRSELKEYQKLTEYIFEKHYDELIDEFEILDRYKNYIDYRQKINFVAKETSDYQKYGKRKLTFSTFYKPEVFTTSLEITKEGNITFQNDKVVKALEGLEAERLRICNACKRIFWANRLDKSGCSNKCNQTLRTRRKREKDNNRFKSRVKKGDSL